MGSAYVGLDVQAVVNGDVPEKTFKRAMRQLQEYSDSNARSPHGQEARRHVSMLEFLYAMEHRYGEVDQILPRIKGDFKTHPLGVSEYFIPPAPGAKVTPLREVEQVSVRMGNSQDPTPMKMSLAPGILNRALSSGTSATSG